MANIVYFSDGYGLKAIDIKDLTGESQSQVRLVFSKDVFPNITFIHGERIDGYDFLVSSLAEAPEFKALWGFVSWDDFLWE